MQSTLTRAAVQQSARDPFELLDRPQIAAEYKIPIPTQATWFSLNRYAWRDICCKVGSRVFVRRRDIEAWLDSRRGIVA